MKITKIVLALLTVSSISVAQASSCYYETVISRGRTTVSDTYQVADSNAMATVSRSGQNLEGSSMLSGSVSAKVYNVSHTETPVIIEKGYSVGKYCAGSRTVYSSGSGNRNLYAMFKNGLTRKQRAVTIADNIKGAGLTVAKALVWHFERSDVPRSWNSFTQLIKKAEQTQVNKGSSLRFYTQITQTYAYENKQNLGFASSYSGQTCAQWIDQCDSTIIYRTEYREHKNYSHTKTVDFDLNIEGVALLKGEKETFKVTYNGARETIAVGTSTSYGSYNANINFVGNSATVDMQGSRKLVNPRSSYSVSIKAGRNNEAIITIRDLNFDSSVNVGEKSVKIDLVNHRGFDETELSQTYDLSSDSATTVIKTGYKMKYGKKGFFGHTERYIAYVKARVLNSQYYNSNYSRSVKSNELKTERR